jgi:hypothetical protein
MPRLHFIAGLPRSGSTLLAGLLRQNPRFAAAMTGPVGGIVGTLLNAMSPQNETAVFLDEAKRQSILRSRSETPLGAWLRGLSERTHPNVVVVALAAKLARIGSRPSRWWRFRCRRLGASVRLPAL